MHMYLQSHVTCQVIGHVRAGEWPEATTPAFTLYEFKLEDKKMMNNFNLRYECLDERDDYHAILKKQSKLKKKKISRSI